MNKAYLVVNGGLGNQLGQAAFGLALERMTGAEILYKVDSFRPDEPYGRTFLLHKYFPRLRRMKTTPGPSDALPIFKEPLDVADPVQVLRDVVRLVSTNAETVVDGYWLNEEYQEADASLIRDSFSFGDMRDEARSEGQALRDADCIGIHVRRADYGHHGLARMSYYRDCLATIRKEKGNLPAVVFTDEYNFCSYEFRAEPNLKVMRGNLADPIEDFYLLTCCKHYVLSNSSFAGWAAKLGQADDSIVYVPLPICAFLQFLTPPRRWRHVRDATQRQ